MENPKIPDLKKKDIPLPPTSFWKIFGVGVIIMGMAIGTGELIMWPYMVVKYGLGILWGALIGITFQYFINQEVARISIATGESFFLASQRVFKWIVFFWLFSAVILYIWPGWMTSLGTSLTALTSLFNYKIWAYICYGIIILFTFLGRIVYKTLEKALMITIPIFFTLILIVSFFNIDFKTLILGIKGLFNFFFIPKDLDYKMFFSAVVFAGAGGLLNLCVSLYYRDKGFGIGKYFGRITNPLTGKEEAVPHTGFIFTPNKKNLEKFKKWMMLVKLDQGIIFWFLGLITLFLLALNSYSVLSPKGLIPTADKIAVVQANIFGEVFGEIGYFIFLCITSLALFSLQWSILDAFSRILSDILYVNSRIGVFYRTFKIFKKFSLSQLYYLFFIGIAIISMLLIPYKMPLTFLKISSLLGGATMAIYTPLLIFLINKKLPKQIRPSIFTSFILGISSIFYLLFTIIILFK